MKVALNDYLNESNYALHTAENWREKLKRFDLNLLENDTQKKAFWLNVYNGFTNLKIILNRLEKSVWELPDFFTNRSLKIGELFYSLDDIEHGILRRNGARRNGKPRQFKTEDLRATFMVEIFDYRIHFALNCGSISCPPLAYYSVDNLNLELKMAEENFVSQEFLVDHDKQEIDSSQIFVWYRDDFKNLFLNDPKMSQYRVAERPYQWKIK